MHVWEVVPLEALGESTAICASFTYLLLIYLKAIRGLGEDGGEVERGGGAGGFSSRRSRAAPRPLVRRLYRAVPPSRAVVALMPP